VWVAFAIASCLWLVTAGEYFLSGLVMGVALCSIKALVGWFVLPLVAASRRRFRACLGLSALPVAVYGWLAVHHVDVLQPLRAESRAVTSGNLPYVLSAAGLNPSGPSGWVCLCVMLACAAVIWRAVLRAGAQESLASTVYAIVATGSIMLLLSKKAYATYMVQYMFCVCLVMYSLRGDCRRTLAVVALFSIAAIEPSMWAHWLGMADFRGLAHHSAPPGPLWHVAGFLVIETCLLTGYGGLIRTSLQRLRLEVPDGGPHPGEPSAAGVRAPASDDEPRAQ